MEDTVNTSTMSHHSLISPRGFLPVKDPLDVLPHEFSELEELGRSLPKLLVTGHLRSAIQKLGPIAVENVRDERELERLMVILSFAGHAYVWGGDEPESRLPRSISVPWLKTARRLRRPPVLSYASYALHNWKRIDPAGPVALGNIALLQNFLGGMDEEWFVLVHVEIEAHAAPALFAALKAKDAAGSGDAGELATALESMAASLADMLRTLNRMPEHCAPYIYFSRVRPYIHGWKDHPALPDGVVYEEIREYAGRPQRFRGETGAQSSIIPSMDAVLDIRHSDDPLEAYLLEMREYMPPKHRSFIEELERPPSVREAVKRLMGELPGLRESYNDCVKLLHRFRSRHLEYAGEYIHRQSLERKTNPTDVGTGGTPFMAYLKKHRDETKEHLI